MNPAIFVSLTASLLFTSIVITPFAHAQDIETSLSSVTEMTQSTNRQSQIKSTVQPQACFRIVWWLPCF